MDLVTSGANKLFSSDMLRLGVITLGSIYAGYTLQPVPEWLNKMFNESLMFKFVVILLICMTSVYPLTDTKIVQSLMVTVVLLMMFHFFRKNDKKEQIN